MSIPRIYSGDSQPSELYNIAPLANVRSILEEGLLSHKRCRRIHHDIADPEVQERRAPKLVDNPSRSKKRVLVLHQYACLYLRAHNAMMFVRRDKDLCVLRIDPAVLTRREVVVTTMNAAKDDVQFFKPGQRELSPDSSEMILESCSQVKTDESERFEKRKAVHQAEALIPYQLHPSYIRGIYVKNLRDRRKLERLFAPGNCPVPIDVHPTLFFAHERIETEVGVNPLRAIAASPLANISHPEIDPTSPESSGGEHE